MAEEKDFRRRDRAEEKDFGRGDRLWLRRKTLAEEKDLGRGERLWERKNTQFSGGKRLQPRKKTSAEKIYFRPEEKDFD